MTVLTENDRLAVHHGYQINEHPRGRQHSSPTYQKGRGYVWQKNGLTDGLYWVSARLNGDRRYTDHQQHPTLAEALLRWCA